MDFYGKPKLPLLDKIIITAVIVVLASQPVSAWWDDSSSKNRRFVEETQRRLMDAQPMPRIDISAERKNLVKRLERLNTQNMSGYVYLISYGQVVSHYPVDGKVTSLNAYLMAGETPCSAEGRMCEQPDLDGAYGQNDQGIFFFTADTDTYVEWKGEYVFTDQPLTLSIQPRLERQVK